MSKQPTIPIEQRFWSKVDRRGPGECWPWKGSKDGQGYGSIRSRIGGRDIRFKSTHIAWELAHRAPWPAGLLALHECDNPPCVNPAHIRPGTHADNTADKLARGRHANVKKTHCKHGHEFTPENTRYLLRDGAIQRDCRRCRAARSSRHRPPPAESARG